MDNKPLNSEQEIALIGAELDFIERMQQLKPSIIENYSGYNANESLRAYYPEQSVSPSSFSDDFWLSRCAMKRRGEI